jgi:hypothetical protein
MLGEPLGRPGTQYAEWVGYASFDDSDHGAHVTLWDLLSKIDPTLTDRYHVIGADIESEQRAGAVGHWLHVTLYLVEQSAIPDGGSIHDLVDSEGALPVVKLDVPDEHTPELGDFLTRTFKRMKIRVTARHSVEGLEPFELKPIDELELGAD